LAAIHARIKIVAATQGISIQWAVREAALAWLARNEQPPRQNRSCVSKKKL
jgi:hypothetical protein